MNMRKAFDSTERPVTAASGSQRKFPPEAYDYHDDITESDLQSVRERAQVELDKDKWVVIDGYVGEKDR